MTVTRVELYKLVWSNPMNTLGDRFGVSGSYLARICTLLNVPRPERGYWAKLEAGKAPSAPPLPEPRPGDPLEWSRDGERSSTQKPAAPAPRSAATTPVKIARNRTHGLLRDAKALLEKGYPIDDGAYLKPYKKLLVDVTTSHACLDKTLALANELFNAMESVGHRVVIAPANEQLRRPRPEEREAGGTARQHWEHRALWSPVRPTVVYVGSMAIGLSIIEMSEHVTLHYLDGKYLREREFRQAPHRYCHQTWTTDRDVPSGRLRIVAYSPYGAIPWSLHWDETKAASLRSSLKSIVEQIEQAAPRLVAMIDEQSRRAEIDRENERLRHAQWLRDEDRRRIAQSVAESQKELREIIQRWTNLASIEAFLAGVEKRASDLPERDRADLGVRLGLAREFLGSQDPLDFFRLWQTPAERYAPKYDDHRTESRSESPALDIES